MAFVSEMFDQMRALLNDDTDTQVSFVRKKLYLNRGIALLWPAIYRVREITLLLTAFQTEYTISGLVSDGYVLSAEISEDSSGSNYTRLQGHELDILPGDEDETPNVYIRDPRLVTEDRYLRLMYAGPFSPIAAVSYTAAQSETWVGPDRALHLPVLYAMFLATAGKVDDRQDHTRYSTTQAANGVNDTDILTAGQTWLNQFYAELEQLSRPLPPTKD